MSLPSNARYRVRVAQTAADLSQAQRLRHLAFVSARFDDGAGGRDADRFDARCTHVLVEEMPSATLVCCFRLLPLQSGAGIAGSYSAQYYELSALAGYGGRMAELGRFCVRPGRRDPDILRAAWGWLAAHVEAEGVELLFGCSSFLGTRADDHVDAFTLLCQRHRAPQQWEPRAKAPEVFRFTPRLLGRLPDPVRALRAMPPLLRSYLAMGGWVSDHAVVDRALGTMHVFTGLEVRNVPAARIQRLRAVAV